MKNRRNDCLLKGLLIGMGLLQHLCGDGAEIGPEEKSETLIISVMAFGSGFFEGIQFEDANGVVQDLVFNPYRRSDTYLHNKDEVVATFFKTVIGSDGKPIRHTLAEIDMSNFEKRALLVFLERRDPKRDLAYRIIAADESEEFFGPGSFRFLNLSGVPLLSKVAQTQVLLQPGFSDTYQFDPEHRQPISFGFAVRVKGDWRPIYATRSQSDLNSGTLVLLKPPATQTSLKIRVHMLVENLK